MRAFFCPPPHPTPRNWEDKLGSTCPFVPLQMGTCAGEWKPWVCSIPAAALRYPVPRLARMSDAQGTAWEWDPAGRRCPWALSSALVHDPSCKSPVRRPPGTNHLHYVVCMRTPHWPAGIPHTHCLACMHTPPYWASVPRSCPRVWPLNITNRLCADSQAVPHAHCPMCTYTPPRRACVPCTHANRKGVRAEWMLPLSTLSIVYISEVPVFTSVKKTGD